MLSECSKSMGLRMLGLEGPNNLKKKNIIQFYFSLDQNFPERPTWFFYFETIYESCENFLSGVRFFFKSLLRRFISPYRIIEV